MLLLKYLLFAGGIGLFFSAVAVIAYDIYEEAERRRLIARGVSETRAAKPLRWSRAQKLVLLAWLPLLVGLSIQVVPSGLAGVRVSQIFGNRPGTLYPGVHLVVPLVDSVAFYDVRDNVFTTTVAEDPKKKAEVLRVHSKEGLSLGLAVAVRYRLDAKRLDYIHGNLPQPIDEQIVAPVVASVFRQLVPNYMVREVFSTRREEIRQHAAELITQRLAADAIVVKEVILRDTLLPPEYAKGLEGLLLKEQENERLSTEIEIKQKLVRTAELEAEAQKTREIKQAEGQAATRVIQAKAEADAMQYTLPLKEKQIQQSRLEAEARKESTLKNAEANAQAKLIDSKAEFERRKLFAEAEANRIRVTALADAERMRTEAIVLKQNPLLIQKIIAERLSDKLQIMMVPSDGKFFFANDVLRGMSTAAGTNTAPQEDPDDPPAGGPAPKPPRRP